AGAIAGRVAGAVAGAFVCAASGNQRSSDLKCIVENIKQKFTLFSPDGIPLRATLTVTLREYKTLDEQLAHLNLSSPDRTHSHVIETGQTLAGISALYYRQPGDWRFIRSEEH